MTYHHGWLMIGEQNGNYQELFNHARTAAYLTGSPTLGCGTVYNVLDDGGCAAYPWMPPDDSSNYAQATFTDPASDSAPWYNSSYPESADALGFWITEWTGLDSAHIRRSLTPVGAYRGGGQLGTTATGAREMGFEVILVGESELALDYLFRWLDATISSVCATCATDSILIRRICPDGGTGGITTANADDGVVEIREVGLLSGLTWGAPPVEQAGCYIRRANFTLAAQDPCMYSACSTVTVDQSTTWSTCFAGTNVNTDRTECRPSCSEMPGACRTTYEFTVNTVGASAPRVLITSSDPSVGDQTVLSGSDGAITASGYTFTSATGGFTPNMVGETITIVGAGLAGADLVTTISVYDSSTQIATTGPAFTTVSSANFTVKHLWVAGNAIRHRIRVYDNAAGRTPAEICGAPLLCELNIAPLPPYTELLYDVAGRQVLIRSAATGLFVNGYAYIESNEVGVPRFAGLGCGDYMVVIEPNDFCFDASGPSFSAAYDATATSVQERMGCA